MISSSLMDFYCERYKCWMTKSACEARKKLAERAKFTRNFNEYNAAGCHKCNQEVVMKNKEEPQQENQTGSIPAGLSGSLDVPKKECNKCHQIKIMDKFSKNQNCKDGHEGQCKECKYQHYKDKMASKKQAKKIISEKKQKPSPAWPMKAAPFTEYVVPEATIQDEKTAVQEPASQTENGIYDDPIGKNELPVKTLSIDFSVCPDIFQAIEDIARDEFRTPEMQVLFWLRWHLSSSRSIEAGFRGKPYQQG